MTSLEKKILDILQIKEFRQNDEINHPDFTRAYDNVTSWNRKIIGVDILLKDVKEDATLITPYITLDDILMAFLKSENIHWYINEYSDKEIIININGGKDIWWILGKPLSEQSKKTKTLLEEIMG